MIKYITTTDDKYELLLKNLSPFMNPVMFDLETTGLDPRQSIILLAQFFIDDIIYVINVQKLGLENFKKLIEDINYYSVQLVAHNAKFDWKFIFHHTKVALNNIFDTMNVE
jgi:ribonuclease D